MQTTDMQEIVASVIESASKKIQAMEKWNHEFLETVHKCLIHPDSKEYQELLKICEDAGLCEIELIDTTQAKIKKVMDRVKN